MKILIYNKIMFNKFMEFNGITDENVESQDMMIISINNPCESDTIMKYSGVYSYFKRQHSNVMIMHFPDFGEALSRDLMKYGDFNVFNEYKAKKLYEFIKRNKDKKFAVLHCGAGISRSGAVGTFIFDLYGTINYEEFKRKNPRILPNSYVLRLLHELARNDVESTNK